MRFFREMKRYLPYAVRAAKADLRAEVADSYLNYLWWLLQPTSSMIIYTLVFGIVFHAKEQYFPIFVFLGVTVWDYFSRLCSTSVNLIRDYQFILNKVYMPKYILLIQRMLVLAFKMLICWGLIIVMMVVYRVHIGWNILMLLPYLLVFFLFCFGVGAILLHMGVYVSDLSNLIAIGLNLMFYITGIFYNVQNSFPKPYGYFFQRMNPIAHMIFSMRKAVLYNELPSVAMFFIWFAISLGLSIWGLHLIYKNENNYVKII